MSTFQQPNVEDSLCSDWLVSVTFIICENFKEEKNERHRTEGTEIKIHYLTWNFKIPFMTLSWMHYLWLIVWKENEICRVLRWQLASVCGGGCCVGFWIILLVRLYIMTSGVVIVIFVANKKGLLISVNKQHRELI